MTLPVDFESWSEVLYSGILVDCRADSHMVKAELVKLRLNTQLEVDRSAKGADKETAHRSWTALRFRSPPHGDSFQVGSGRSNLTKVEFC